MLDLSQNYFALFGLPVAYGLDEEQLAERYRALQQQLHPDRFAAASDQERRLSLQASMRVNEAYQVLRDPLARARYLLTLQTQEAIPENESTQDGAFLLEQMALREALEEAKEQPDPYGFIGTVLQQLDRQEQDLLAQLPSRLENPNPQHLEEARELIRKLQFVRRCRTEAEQLESELDAF